MDRYVVLRQFVRTIVNGNGSTKIEFYSGRILLYTLLESLGFDGENVYDITEFNINTLSVDDFMNILVKE